MFSLLEHISNVYVRYYGGSRLLCPENWKGINVTCKYSKFYYISGGECIIEMGNNKYEGKAGSLFLIPAGVKHSFYHINKNYVEKYWFHFDIENLFDIMEFPCYINIGNDAKIEGLFKSIFENEEKNVANLILQKAKILELTALYLSHFEINEFIEFVTPTTLYEDLTKIMQHINDNMHRKLTIAELAEEVHLHPNYFIKIFKDKFGMAPMKYINKLKIEKIKNLLLTTSMPVNQIMQLVGFTDIYHFSKFFKQYTGYSPKSFQEIYKS